MKTSILGTGLSGLVGSRIVELLSPQFDFEDLSLDTGVDITNKDQVFEKVRSSQARWIFHLAAKTDVDGCEEDKPLGERGDAWKINVEGTRNIVEAAAETGKRVLCISTDFVFDGTKETYTEEDKPSPINWYGVTKYEGEKIVLKNKQNIVVRITYPYRAKNPAKRDFVHVVIDRLTKGQITPMLTDHYFSPTFIDDLAHAVNALIANHIPGIYHVVGGSSLSPSEAGYTIARTFNLPDKYIVRTTIAEYFKDRAPRPYKLRTKNGRITKLGVRMRTFLDGINEVKKQGIT